MSKAFVREKKIYCGKDYLEVDIYTLTDEQLKSRKGKRNKAKKVSLKAQQELNDKNARRRFLQIAETNFTEDDLSVTLTYNQDNIPETIERAEREVNNYIRRIKRLREKKGLPKLKYMLVTSSRTKKDDEEEEPIRIHHHILMNSGLSRDEVEDLWRKRRKAGENKGEYIGVINADKIKKDPNSGIAGLCTYLIGNPTQKRRWTCSQNLERPIERSNDHKYSRRRIINIAKRPLDIDYWQRKYKGYTIADKINGYEVVYNDFSGWTIYLKLRRIKK